MKIKTGKSGNLKKCIVSISLGTLATQFIVKSNFYIGLPTVYLDIKFRQ